MNGRTSGWSETFLSTDGYCHVLSRITNWKVVSTANSQQRKNVSSTRLEIRTRYKANVELLQRIRYFRHERYFNPRTLVNLATEIIAIIIIPAFHSVTDDDEK